MKNLRKLFLDSYIRNVIQKFRSCRLKVVASIEKTSSSRYVAYVTDRMCPHILRVASGFGGGVFSLSDMSWLHHLRGLPLPLLSSTIPHKSLSRGKCCFICPKIFELLPHNIALQPVFWYVAQFIQNGDAKRPTYTHIHIYIQTSC